MTEVLPDAFGPRATWRPGDAAESRRSTRSTSSAPSATAHALSDEQIDWVIDAYTRGDVADEQMSALAMAILLNGMTAGRSPAGPTR